MEPLIIILSIVWSILCLILFFKIWAMTNDVNELKNYLVKKEDDSISDKDIAMRIKHLYFSGLEDDAYKLLNSFVFKKLSKLKSAYKGEKGFIVNASFDQRLGHEDYKPVEEYISSTLGKYDGLYKLIGKEMPMQLKNITYQSYIAFDNFS